MNNAPLITANFGSIVAFARLLVLQLPPRTASVTLVTKGNSNIESDAVANPTLLNAVNQLGLVNYDKETFTELLSAIAATGQTCGNLVSRDYNVSAKKKEVVYGISVGQVTLWFTDRIEKIASSINLRDPANDLAKIGMNASAIIVNKVDNPVSDSFEPMSRMMPNHADAEDLSSAERWFKAVGEIPTEQRDWLQTQIKAALLRIECGDLYDTFEALTKGSSDEAV